MAEAGTRSFSVLLMLVLVMYASHQISQFGWNTYMTFISPTEPNTSNIISPQLVAVKTQTYGDWLNNAAISPPVAQQQIVETKPVQAPTRTIDIAIDIIGLIGSGTLGAAIMQVQNKPARVYLVGDIIYEDIVLLAVTTNTVIVGVDGIQKTYEYKKTPSVIENVQTELQTNNALPNAENAPATQTAQINNQNNNQNTNTTQPVQNNNPPKNTVVVIASQTLNQEQKNKLSELESNLQNDILKVAQDFQFTNVALGGGQVGLLVASSSYRNLLNAMGLFDSDIILRVNGHSIKQIQTNPTLWSQLTKSKKFNLDILRNSERQTISVQL